jgi:hypothetical protein
MQPKSIPIHANLVLLGKAQKIPRHVLLISGKASKKGGTKSDHHTNTQGILKF